MAYIGKPIENANAKINKVLVTIGFVRGLMLFRPANKSVIKTINVYKVQIPKKLEKQKDEILDILKEALEAYGSSSGNHHEYFSAVHVKYN